MAGRQRGAGRLWALGGAALGACLAGVATQLVEVRYRITEGAGYWHSPGRGLRVRGAGSIPSSCLVGWVVPPLALHA